MRSPHKEYFRHYSLTDPAYNIARIAGKSIREGASRYFSGKMLEIGCGTKAKALLVGEYVEEHVGLDHQDSQHDKSNVDLFGSAYDIPADDNSFDCVLSTAVLEHLEEPQKALNEAFRIPTPGGHAIYTIPLFWHLHEEPRDFFRYTKWGLRYLFENAGFEIIELKALSGFWITFGSGLAYYLHSFSWKPLKYLIRLFTIIGNFIFFAFDKIDKKLHPITERWTWTYFVVAKKPAKIPEGVL